MIIIIIITADKSIRRMAFAKNEYCAISLSNLQLNSIHVAILIISSDRPLLGLSNPTQTIVLLCAHSVQKICFSQNAWQLSECEHWHSDFLSWLCASKSLKSFSKIYSDRNLVILNAKHCHPLQSTLFRWLFFSFIFVAVIVIVVVVA